MKLAGIWGGIAIGSAVVAIAFTVIILRADWEDICTYTAFRIQAEKNHLGLGNFSEYDDSIED